MSIINLEDWLVSEQGGYATGTDPMGGVPGGPPMGDPFAGGAAAPAASPGGDPNIANMPMGDVGQTPPEQMDIGTEPETPDMPEDMGEEEELDFESWKRKFLITSIKGDVEEMKDMLLDIRERDLDDYQDKFIFDNLQIIFLRENSNIDKASKEIRKNIKTDLDHNNPATSIVNHISHTFQEQPLLNNIFIKLTGLYGMKGDPHRKFIGSLTGSVQVGSGGAVEDLIFNEKDYSVRISTRMNARFGNIYLGDWTLREDDPERYLKSPELKRLEEGSPEEKDALRKRIIMESMAESFKTRAFIITVVGTNGTIYNLGWDLSTSLKSAYTEGKLVIRVTDDDNVEVMIDDDGAVIPFSEVKVMYMQDTGEQDDEGKPIQREVEFIERRNGQLYLVAELPILKDAVTSFQGIVLKDTPWQGNPSDLKILQRCVPSMSELLLRNC